MGFTEYLWGWVTYFQAYFQWSKKCTLVLIGLDNAGKTSTLIRLSTDRMSNPVPTQMPGTLNQRCLSVIITLLLMVI